MRGMLRFSLALAAALLLMVAVRALAFTVYSVPGNALSPHFVSGDRIVVNRWSYGLRVGGEGLVPYGRIGRQPVCRGDIVAFELPTDSLGGVFIGRCRAIPGDTLPMADGPAVVPGRISCAKTDYYWLEAITPGSAVDLRHQGFIPEHCIIGRVMGVLYSIDASKPLHQAFRKERLLR